MRLENHVAVGRDVTDTAEVADAGVAWANALGKEIAVLDGLLGELEALGGKISTRRNLVRLRRMRRRKMMMTLTMTIPVVIVIMMRWLRKIRMILDKPALKIREIWYLRESNHRYGKSGEYYRPKLAMLLSMPKIMIVLGGDSIVLLYIRKRDEQITHIPYTPKSVT